MAISYPLEMPTAIIGLASFTLRRQEPQVMSVSPWTGVQQVQTSRAQWWEADFSLPPMKREQADEWEAWALQLSGTVGTFLMGDPEHAAPRGIGGGSPVVASGGQYENTLDISAAPANITGWLKTGDFFQLGSGGTARLYRSLTDVDTTSNGDANILCWPSLRRPSIGGEPVTITNPQGRWRLVTGAQDFARVPLFTSTSFRAIEALDGIS